MVCPEQISSTTLGKEQKDAVKEASFKLKFPLITWNEDIFYSTSGYDITAMNAWFRRNGWHRPINILLPVTLFSWCFAVSGYFGFWTRLFPATTGYIVLHVICGLLVLFQIFSMIYCITAETQDDVVLRTNKPRNLNFHKVVGVPVIDPDNRFCDICQVHVQFETKHCKMCNKCVEKYDHHCAFMSTCVGRKNYKPFMVAITTAAIIGLYFAVVAIYGFIIFFTDRSLFYSSVLKTEQSLSNLSEIFIIIGIAIYIMAVLSMAIALSGLSIFHYRLIYIGMTTDAYISSRNARGPDIWSINTAEYKKKMEEARKYQVAYHEPLSIVSIDKGDAVEIK